MEWTDFRYCHHGFANGFKLKVQTSQGTHDDNGATNFALLCGPFKTSENFETVSHSLSHEPGDWGVNKWCPDGTKLCNIKTKVEWGGSSR